MRDFLEGHRCNAICRHLNLPEPIVTPAPPAARTYVPVHGSTTSTSSRRPMPTGVVTGFCGLAIVEESGDDWSEDGGTVYADPY